MIADSPKASAALSRRCLQLMLIGRDKTKSRPDFSTTRRPPTLLGADFWLGGLGVDKSLLAT